MMNAYHNMSVPPRTTVNQTVKSVGEHLAFKMSEIDFSPPFRPPGDFPTPQAWLDDFLATHQDALESVLRPTGFMVALVHEDSRRCQWRNRFWPFCQDPVLAVSVLGRIAGNIYIPLRKITLGPWFDNGKCYIFPRKYFPRKKNNSTENQP